MTWPGIEHWPMTTWALTPSISLLLSVRTLHDIWDISEITTIFHRLAWGFQSKKFESPYFQKFFNVGGIDTASSNIYKNKEEWLPLNGCFYYTVKPVLKWPFIKRNFVLNGNIFRSRDYHSIPWLNGNLASAEKCSGPLRFHLRQVLLYHVSRQRMTQTFWLIPSSPYMKATYLRNILYMCSCHHCLFILIKRCGNG
jgi:hypothetical protein